MSITCNTKFLKQKFNLSGVKLLSTKLPKFKKFETNLFFGYAIALNLLMIKNDNRIWVLEKIVYKATLNWL